MTLPDERRRAVRAVRLFLLRLTVPSVTPRVPPAIRREARALLKHYPISGERT